MSRNLIDQVQDGGQSFELEHRCSNGACLAAGLGCWSASPCSSR